MRKIGKQPLRLSLIALLFIVVLSPLCSSVNATGYYVVNCLVAYDEEWQEVAWNTYLYRPETLARIIFDEVAYEFWNCHAIDLRLVVFRSWDSDDSPETADQMMDELICEIGFTSGNTYDGFTVHVLIGLTDQMIPLCYGYCDTELGVVLVTEYTTITGGQHTDNILQHELTHLYGLSDADQHYEEGVDCVLNLYPMWLPFPDHHWIYTCMLTNNWCSECRDTIMLNRANWGYYSTGSGGGGGYHHCLN